LPLLTTYRPNFCCECGEQIVRLRWHVWTSRRFCDKCFRETRKDYRLQRLIVTVILLVIGVLIGRGCRHERPPLVIERPAQSTSNTNQGNPQAQSVTDQVYTCGARTKKGKPCSRRVHGFVRCWQHKGLPAMLPEDKLIIKD